MMTKGQFKHALKMAMEEKRTYEKAMEADISRNEYIDYIAEENVKNPENMRIFAYKL